MIEIGNDAWKEKYGRNALPSYVYYVDEKDSILAERKINQLRIAKVKSDEQYFPLLQAILNKLIKAFWMNITLMPQFIGWKKIVKQKMN